VRQRRGYAAADDRRGFVNQLVVGQSLHHEQGEIRTARHVARQDRIAHVPASHRQALTFAFFQVAAAHDRPASIADEDPPAGLHLVVDADDGKEPHE